MELGDDARTIVALLPALEVADPPDLSWDVGGSSPGTSSTAPWRSGRACEAGDARATRGYS